MKAFKLGQRVLVQQDGEGNLVGIAGAVVRLCRNDNGAWVKLDTRHAACPFPEGDARDHNIKAFPDDCAAVRR